MVVVTYSSVVVLNDFILLSNFKFLLRMIDFVRKGRQGKANWGTFLPCWTFGGTLLHFRALGRHKGYVLMHSCSFGGLICVVRIRWLSRFSTTHIEKPAKMIARLIIIIMVATSPYYIFCFLFLLVMSLIYCYRQTVLARFVCNLRSWIRCSVISDILVFGSRFGIAWQIHRRFVVSIKQLAWSFLQKCILGGCLLRLKLSLVFWALRLHSVRKDRLEIGIILADLIN